MSQLYIYEPRTFFLGGVAQLVEKGKYQFQTCCSLSALMSTLTEPTTCNKIVLAGIAGTGESLFDFLRFLIKLRRLKIKTIVWVPEGRPWLMQLLHALKVSSVISEGELHAVLCQILQLKNGDKIESSPLPEPLSGPRKITATELEILQQFSAGGVSREMAEQRGRSHKTIFSLKHNICESLQIKTNAQWVEMLTEIVETVSLYQREKINAAL